MLIDYNYTWLVISLSQWLWSHVWIYFGTHQSGSARRSYSSWARADYPRVSQAACRKGNQNSIKENLLFLSQNDFGNLNFHQCKYKFLCSALRLIGTMFSHCLVTLPHPVSPWPRERGQQTDSSARSSATGRRAWARPCERGQGSPPALTLICIVGLQTTILTFCTSSLCSQSRGKAIRTNADEEHGLKTSRKKPFPQVLPSASHHPNFK